MTSLPATAQADVHEVTLMMSLHSDTDYADIPDYAQATITREEVDKWKKLAETVAELGAHCIQLYDYRCTFWDEVYGDDEGGSTVESDDRQDLGFLVITADSFGWRGYFKHSNIDWATSMKKFEDALA